MKRLVAAIGIVWAAAGIVGAQGAAQDKIFSRQKAFYIPFQIDSAEQARLQEVQLYVSREGGRWERYTTAPPDLAPDKRRFTFRTDQDGEYCFAVCTLDKNGVQNPREEDLRVGLRVLVDSEVPKIDLRWLTRPGREVGVQWEVSDRNLDLDSMKLEYRVEGQETWQAVPGFVPRFRGDVAWTPEAPGRVTVRCQVADLAKNLGIKMLDPDTGTAGRTSAAGNEPIAKPYNWLTDAPPARRDSTPTTPAAAARRDTAQSNAGYEQRSSSFATDPPAESLSDTARSKPYSGAGGFYGKSASDTTGAAATAGRSAHATSRGSLPANRQIVRNPVVSLDYQIDDEGPSGVSVVELYVTTDMGQSWQRVGEAPERRSPFDVNLGGDGLYGLTLIAKNGLGFGDRPPTAGDQPQTWIEVDSTPPQVRLFTPELGKGPEQGKLIITWKAEDANLGDRCVSLYYTDTTKDNRPDWKTIMTGIENTGRYVWQLDGQVPFKFRVAIEVSDLAGNRQLAESPDVTVDTSKPRPRISGINAVGSTRR